MSEPPVTRKGTTHPRQKAGTMNPEQSGLPGLKTHRERAPPTHRRHDGKDAGPRCRATPS